MNDDASGQIAKWLVLFGASCIVIGGLVLVLRKLPGLERFPLDIVVRRPGFAFYFPLGTCIIASLILTGILWLIDRLRH